MAVTVKAATAPMLQIHLEPDAPIEVSELTRALNALSHQYQVFVLKEGHAASAGGAKLLVSNVAPGSIDINLVPDMASLGAILGPMLDQLDLITRFAEQIRRLLDVFAPRETPAPDGPEVSISQCEDAISIAAPIANHGGSQSVNIVNGPLVQNVFQISQPEARHIKEHAAREKALLESPQSARRERVSMIWKRLDRDPAQTQGRSPDKGLIEEIDPKPKAVLFTDDLTYLKDEMIADEENPYQKVYFVDVEISRIGGRIAAYRVYGYHGKDDLPTD